MSQYKNDMTDAHEPRTADEQQELFRRWKAGDAAARDELILSALPLIFSVCAELQNEFPPGLQLEDAVAEANLSFISALDLYDPDKSAFSTFVYNRAWYSLKNGSIRREKRHADHCVSASDHEEIDQTIDERCQNELEQVLDDDEPLGSEDIQLLEDIHGCHSQAPKGVMGVCRKYNLTWRQLFAYMDQIDDRLQEGATAHSLLAA